MGAEWAGCRRSADSQPDSATVTAARRRSASECESACCGSASFSSLCPPLPLRSPTPFTDPSGVAVGQLAPKSPHDPFANDPPIANGADNPPLHDTTLLLRTPHTHTLDNKFAIHSPSLHLRTLQPHRPTRLPPSVRRDVVARRCAAPSAGSGQRVGGGQDGAGKEGQQGREGKEAASRWGGWGQKTCTASGSPMATIRALPLCR